MKKLFVQSGVYESLLTYDLVVVAPSSSSFFTVGRMWMLVIILLVAGGPTQRLMNPRLRIAQGSERRLGQVGEPHSRACKKFGFDVAASDNFRRTQIFFVPRLLWPTNLPSKRQSVLRSQPLRQYKTLWAFQSELNEE